MKVDNSKQADVKRIELGMRSLRHAAKSWLGNGLVKSRLHRAALRDRGVIVAFHRVSDDFPEDSLTRPLTTSSSSVAFSRHTSMSRHWMT